MEYVTVLRQNEPVKVDPARLGDLYAQLGATSAEDVLCRAIEELAVRLTHGEELFRTGRLDDLRRTVRSVVAIADQIGMSVLAQVAGDVRACIVAGDDVALAATFARLLRVGERSLTDVWDMQDLSV